MPTFGPSTDLQSETLINQLDRNSLLTLASIYVTVHVHKCLCVFLETFLARNVSKNTHRQARRAGMRNRKLTRCGLTTMGLYTVYM